MNKLATSLLSVSALFSMAAYADGVVDPSSIDILGIKTGMNLSVVEARLKSEGWLYKQERIYSNYLLKGFYALSPDKQTDLAIQADNDGIIYAITRNSSFEEGKYPVLKDTIKSVQDKYGFLPNVKDPIIKENDNFSVEFVYPLDNPTKVVSVKSTNTYCFPKGVSYSGFQILDSNVNHADFHEPLAYNTKTSWASLGFNFDFIKKYSNDKCGIDVTYKFNTSSNQNLLYKLYVSVFDWRLLKSALNASDRAMELKKSKELELANKNKTNL